MKKMLSLLLSTAMLISALPVRAENAASTDQYFTDTRTVDYNKSYWQGHSGKYSTNADDYKFVTKDGDYFSLLDVKDDTNSKYFIITSKKYANAAKFTENNVAEYFGMPAAGLTFASDDEKNYQYPSWGLNGNMFMKAYGYREPVSVRISDTARSCIDMNHTWTVEPTPNARINGESFPNELYTYTAGIAYPSMSEVVTYADRFLEANTEKITTRTFINNDGDSVKNRAPIVIDTTGTDTTKWTSGGWTLGAESYPVRPCFWANDQFFAKVAVDLSTAGAAVLQEIKKVKTTSLVNLYSANELETYLDIDVDNIDLFFKNDVTVNYNTTYNQGYSGNYSTNASAYLFTTSEGETFSLLDVKDSASSKYFVTTKKLYSQAQALRESGVAEYFKMPDSSVTVTGSNKNYQYPSWALNGAPFKNGESFSKLDDVPVRISDTVRSYIDMNHTWTVEPTPNAKNNGAALPNEMYTFTAGIAYPSVSEVAAYADRFLESGGASITTRTFINNNTINNRWVAVVSTGDSSKWAIGGTSISSSDNKTNFPVRPVFWLNDQFFANVAVDLSTAGAAVKQEIKKVSLYKLLELYTADELRNQLGLTIPNETLELYNVEVRTRSGNDPAYGETLIPYYNVFSDAGFDIKDVEVTWKKTDGKTETTIGTSKEYIVTEADAADGKTKIYFDLKVTGATGTTLERTSYKTTIDSLGVEPVYAHSKLNGVKGHADKADTFKVGDKTFTLLDTFDNDESTFFVTVNDYYGTKDISSIYMDPTDPTSYAYWMDKIFKTSGNGDGKVLPTQIVKYINNNHIWLTEGAPESPTGTSKSNDDIAAQNYTFKAGVAPISVSEIKRYKDVIGSADGFEEISKAAFFTRTGANNTEINNSTVDYIICATRGLNADDATSDNMWFPHWNVGSGTHIKPVFYLTKEFFKNVELDMRNVGDNVWAAMKEVYSIEELSDIYDEETLSDMGFTSKSTFSVSYSKYGDAADLYETLNGATSLQANVTYTAATAGINAKAILALYDGNGKLVEVAVKPLISTGTTASATVGFEELSDIGLGHYTKLMLWDDMKPITKADIFSSDNGLNLAENVSVLTSTSEGNNFF